MTFKEESDVSGTVFVYIFIAQAISFGGITGFVKEKDQ